MDHHCSYYPSTVNGVQQGLLFKKSLAKLYSAVEPAGTGWKKKTANGCLADSLAAF